MSPNDREELKEIANKIYTNLRDTQDIIESSTSEDKEIVYSKYITTINMLLEGTIGIKDGVLRDLEKGIE